VGPTPPTRNLLSGRLLARNVFWNLIGLTAPLLVAVIAVPILIAVLGAERFGLLAIIWMGIGYFSVFDMGVGRALTKMLAQRLVHPAARDLSELLWTALAIILFLGVVGTAIVMAAADWIVRELFVVNPGLQVEGAAALRIFGCGLPIVVLTTALVGVLEAHQRFAAISALRALLGFLTFLLPLLIIQFTPSLAFITASLLLTRIVAFVAFFLLARSARPELRRVTIPRFSHVRPLLTFGGWLTVTNIVSPLMVYCDRFLIGALMSMTAVAFYVTPFELISRLSLVPQAFIGVLFPAFATAVVADRSRLANLYSQSSRVLFLLMLSPVIALFLFAPETLSLWLGNDFARASTSVVHWLCAGVLVNTLARPSFALLQSDGRPDIVAKLHLAELAPYGVLLYVLILEFGITGAAIAWTIRMTVDTVALNLLAARQVPKIAPIITQKLFAVPVLSVFLISATYLESVLARGGLFAVTCLASGALLLPQARALLRLRTDSAGGAS
jgi:O-antigen/teichoic acid export membrane protein